MSAVLSLAGGQSAARGQVHLYQPGQPRGYAEVDVRALVERHGLPQRGLPEEVNRWRAANSKRFTAAIQKARVARKHQLPCILGALYCHLVRASGDEVWYGLASLRVVTTAGVGFLVDAWQNILELELQKFHALGTGGTAEAIGDTALVTELTTQYNPDNTRATGSLTEGASANIFRSVGTNTVDSSVAITEHGLMSSATVGAGVLFDRSLFSVINLSSADSLQTTYDCLVSAGG